MSSKFVNRLKKIIKDPGYLDKYLFCRFFGFNYNEFKYYHFKTKFFKRFSFISFKKCVQIFPKYNKKITNKKENYLLLKEYFKRDCCLIEKEKSKKENEIILNSFLNKHKQFVAKSYDGDSSLGIKKYDINEDFGLDNILDDYPNGCLLEEMINQTSDIAKIHPSSINTLRITTINYKNNIDAIYPVMRFGVNNEFIDNKFGNSLLCAINKDDEIFLAINGKGDKFINHPDTNEKLIGFKVPELNNAIELAKKLATYFPENVFTGFDFAHTENGWILVEANTETRFTIWQLPYQKGFKKELKKIDKCLERRCDNEKR